MLEIYSFDTRNIIIWDVMRDQWAMTHEQMHEAIIDQFNALEQRLKDRGFSYDEFKNILIPNKDKHDVCFIFDSLKSNNQINYGSEIFSTIIPEILKISKVAVFYGDIIGGNSRESQIRIKNELYQRLSKTDKIDFQHSNQFFVVYINNVTAHTIKVVDSNVARCSSYIGYADLTYRCYLKDVIASCIGQGFLKIGNNLLIPTPYDDEDSPSGYIPFNCEEYPLNLVGINDIDFGSFLAYKIERTYHNFDNGDQLNVLNAVTTSPVILADYSIVIDDRRYEYITNAKKGSLSITGLNALTKEELICVLKRQFNTNYIFNISFSDEYQCLKFATIIEIYKDSKRRKYVAAFKVKKEQREIELLSMY